MVHCWRDWALYGFWIFNQANSNSLESLLPCCQKESLSSGLWLKWTLFGRSVLSDECSPRATLFPSPPAVVISRGTHKQIDRPKKNSSPSRAHASPGHGRHPQPGNACPLSTPNSHYCESPPVFLVIIFISCVLRFWLMLFTSSVINVCVMNPVHVFTLVWSLYGCSSVDMVVLRALCFVTE